MRKKLLDFMQGRFGILWCMAVILSGMFPVKAILAGQEKADCPPLAGVQGVDSHSSEAHPTEICKLLTNKTASEKAQIKSREIAKRDFKGEYTNTQYGVRVEIIGEVKEININGQSGIELFAKAWRGDKQLGFSKDGSVEIERFRIFNPPILVDDPNGDIVREWTDKITGELKQRKLREDPLQAIKEVIAHNVTLVGKDNNNIKVGTVGNTTSTFYPSLDGWVVRDITSETLSTLRAGAGTFADDSDVNVQSASIRTLESNTNEFDFLRRGLFFFDTSSIPDTDIVDSATISFYGVNRSTGIGNPDFHVAQGNAASNTALVASDYAQANFGTTSFGNVTYANFSTAAYNDITLNSSGISNISKTGISKFSTQLSWDINNSFTGTWAGGGTGSDIVVRAVDQAGTTQDPKLVVVHSAPTSSGTITRVVNGGGSILGVSSLTMNFNITGSNLILFVSTFKQNSETITGVTWNGVPLTQVESVISYTTNNVQLWYLLAPAVGIHDLVTTASGSSGYIITYYTLYSGVKQTGQLDGSTRVTGNTPITATITTGTDNTWAFLTSVQGGSAGTNATLIAEGDMRTYDNQGYGTIAPGTAFSMTVNLQPGNTGGVIMATFKDATPPATPTPTPSPTPIQTDTTAPIVTITSPTSSDTYTATSSTISLGGSASDSTSGVKELTWNNDKGGSGTASGTISWTISSISLSTGDNVITVTAKDGAGNSGTDTITVIVPASTPTPSPTPTPATTPVPTPTPTEKGAIVGTVVDEVAGVGITGAKIILDKGGYSATTGVDGSYTIVDVPAGDYTLTASADGYKSSSQTVTVYAGEATVADFLLKRASEGIVFGFVIDEDSNPLKGVTVTITVNNSSGNTETDDDGYYEFRDLEAGGYILTFEKSGFRTQTLDITLTSEESLEAETITMELEVKGSIFGYVVDISGNPIESVKLKLKGIKTKIKRNASSDADGFFEFADLEKDKYVIFASKKRYKKAKQTVSLDEGDDQEIEIEMGKSSSSRRVIPEAGE